jgi:hypothetical protein
VLHLRANVGADISAWASLQPNMFLVLYLHWNLGSGGDVLGHPIQCGAQWLFFVCFSRRSFLLHGAHLRQNNGGGLKSEINSEVCLQFNTSLKVRRTSNMLAKIVQDEAYGSARQQARN